MCLCRLEFAVKVSVDNFINALLFHALNKTNGRLDSVCVRWGDISEGVKHSQMMHYGGLVMSSLSKPREFKMYSKQEEYTMRITKASWIFCFFI